RLARSKAIDDISIHWLRGPRVELLEKTMENPPDVLHEYRVKIIPAVDAEPLPAYPDDMGLRTKFGGSPDAIQNGGDSNRKCREDVHRKHLVALISALV